MWRTLLPLGIHAAVQERTALRCLTHALCSKSNPGRWLMLTSRCSVKYNLGTQGHTHVLHLHGLVSHADDLLVECQCQRVAKSDLSVLTRYCSFCNLSKRCAPLMYHSFVLILCRGFFFFGSSLTRVRCCMLTTAPLVTGWWVCSCWPTFGSATPSWSLWNTTQRNSPSTFPSSPHTHYGEIHVGSHCRFYGQKNPAVGKCTFWWFTSHHLNNWCCLK